MDKDIIWWLGAVLFFVSAEVGTVQLVSFWFIGGSIAALIAAMCGAVLELQLGLFFGVSLLLLFSLRPIFIKYVKPRTVATNADSNIGKIALVTESIDNIRQLGAVKIGGTVWTARSLDGKNIEQDSLVVIRKIEGVKLYVELAEVAAN